MPGFTAMGQVKMPDGNVALVMSPKQWAQYNYDYNEANELPQPEDLKLEVKRYAEEQRRKDASLWHAK